MGEGYSPIGEQLSNLAPGIYSVYDGLGWIVPALFLTLLLFAFYVLLCWTFEDMIIDFPLIRGPRFIFGWSRKLWRGEPLDE
jgi:uncharacterized membrane protein